MGKIERMAREVQIKRLTRGLDSIERRTLLQRQRCLLELTVSERVAPRGFNGVIGASVVVPPPVLESAVREAEGHPTTPHSAHTPPVTRRVRVGSNVDVCSEDNPWLHGWVPVLRACRSPV